MVNSDSDESKSEECCSGSEMTRTDGTFELPQTKPLRALTITSFLTKTPSSPTTLSLSHFLGRGAAYERFIIDLHNLASLRFTMASKCVHKGCGKVFTDPEEPCVYHPGPPVFHEGQKGK
jgi:hypothetical protein